MWDTIDRQVLSVFSTTKIDTFFFEQIIVHIQTDPGLVTRVNNCIGRLDNPMEVLYNASACFSSPSRLHHTILPSKRSSTGCISGGMKNTPNDLVVCGSD